jgi:primase-polymerase (primpol)-like protein
LTGQHLEGTPTTVGSRPDAIAAIHRETFGDAQPRVEPGPKHAHAQLSSSALQLSDVDVIRLASESPHNGERFCRLWDGDPSDYPSESEADAALCELLAYYGGPDPERIERLWLSSGLARPKTERADYRQRTIALALSGKTRFYGDRVGPLQPTATTCTCACCDHRAGGPELDRRRRPA